MPVRPFLLKLEQAAELGLINSREFQDRREGLYLTALPVTLERFAFAAQFFFNEEIIRQVTGRETDTGQTNQWRFNSTTGFSKMFSTGALLLFKFANQTVINLTGQNLKHTISESTIDLDIVQPLLRGGGRAVALEPLTQSERTLLYGIRDYAHFRKDFFVSIAAGGEFTNTVIGIPAGLARAPIPSPVAGIVSVPGERVVFGQAGVLGVTGPSAPVTAASARHWSSRKSCSP